MRKPPGADQCAGDRACLTARDTRERQLRAEDIARDRLRVAAAMCRTEQNAA